MLPVFTCFAHPTIMKTDKRAVLIVEQYDVSVVMLVFYLYADNIK